MESISVERAVARIRERNDVLRAVLEIVPNPKNDRRGPLSGVPYLLKDTWDTRGIRTTGGSFRHRARIPASSCKAHRAFEAAGAVLLGKSNLCDLAFSSESDNHLFGPVCNPYDLTRTAGGSTGGGAAAVADGMAAFDWGTDFGGSIRGPAAFCGVVGLRLSHRTWPVGFDHFPRIPPVLWHLCGMGPVTRDVATTKTVLGAVRAMLRRGPEVSFETKRVALWLPDKEHACEWPSFEEDARRVLRRAGIACEVASDLPTPTKVNALYTEYLAAHFDEFITHGDIPLRDGLPAVLLGLLSKGKLDKRVHPNTGILLGGVFVLGLVHRDRKKAQAKLDALRARVQSYFARGIFLVSPACTLRPPLHGKSAFSLRLMSFCKLGNLVDATAIALPHAPFEGCSLPRSFQILGAPGCDEALLEIAARIEAHSNPSATSISNIASTASGVG